MITRSLMIASTLLAACTAEPVDPNTAEVEQHTAGSGIVGPIIANGLLGPAEIEIKWGDHTAKIETSVRVVTQDITIQPGGFSGWHTHPGPVFATITAGTASLFSGEDPCNGTDYPAGTAFVDPGGGHVHIARNNGTTVVNIKATYLIPDGTGIRIDAPAPAGSELCP
jgi:quercetin dioxygenase-like cupin family protein